MPTEKGIISIIFAVSLAISVPFGAILVDMETYLIALVLYLIFSLLYFNLRIFSKKGKVNIDYGTSYSMSFVLFAGPLGLLIYETIYRTTVYFYKKKTNTADSDEFMHLFYNIGSFVLANSLAFYLYINVFPMIENASFEYWVLFFVLVFGTAMLTDTFLVIICYFLGELNTKQEIIDFYKGRSWLDTGKVTLTNGLLLVFLNEGKWEVIVAFFILNYLVSRSFIVKSQSLQYRAERDKFEQMAYTDFLTGIPNRAHMDKTMKILQDSGEYLGVVVADIDHFKVINDSYNHAVGDIVIQHFATLLQDNLEKDAYIFRSGGEEFTLFLRNQSYEDTVNLVETLQSCVERSIVDATFKNSDVQIQYTASFGLYYYKVNNNFSLEKAYIYADNLLFHSKKIGRNRVSVTNGMIDVPLSNRY
ncbi:GGDEF domain-containing protein [Virgibacillus necropolis]|uniref:GGDEF domain-containing protein n=1 Tax=Virgibacillus necropolis TaxID=163877 RepID=UPI00384AED24